MLQDVQEDRVKHNIRDFCRNVSKLLLSIRGLHRSALNQCTKHKYTHRKYARLKYEVQNQAWELLTFLALQMLLEHANPLFCQVKEIIYRVIKSRTSMIFLANNQIAALFHVFIYFISLHISSIIVLIIRRPNCINKSYGMISLCKCLLGMPVRREMQFPPDRHTKQSLTQTNHTRWCINTIRSPDDGRCDARNM